MTPFISDMINLYQFPSGRAAFALKSVHRTATEMGEAEIAQAAADAVELASIALTIRREFYATRQDERRHASHAAGELDAKLDRTIGALHSLLQTAVRTLDADEPLHAQAAAALQRVFPKGAAAVTRLSYEESEEAVGEILPLMQGELAPTFVALGLSLYVERAARLHGQFVDALNSEPKPAVSFDQVRAAETRLQQALHATVARILGRFPTATDEDSTSRALLLAPVITQNERLGDSFRRQRPATDVDPESGEEQPAEEPAAAEHPVTSSPAA